MPGIVGWTCSCGQTDNMGQFCLACGKVRPVGAVDVRDTRQKEYQKKIVASDLKDSVKSAASEDPEVPAASVFEKTEKSAPEEVPHVSEYRDYTKEAVASEIPQTAPASTGRGLGIAAMVTGIASCAFCWVPFLGLACGIAGAVLSYFATVKETQNGRVKCGIVTSAIGLTIACVVLGFFFF